MARYPLPINSWNSSSYGYDANGNQSTRNGQTTTWYSYNLPNTINGGTGFSSQFFHTPGRERWKQAAVYGGTAETTTYIAGLVERVVLGGVTSWKHFTGGGSGPVAVYTRKTSGSPLIETHYLTRDHLGSVDSVTSASGTIEVRLSYTSFGQRRNEAGWSGNPTSSDWAEITDSTRRGFTFHEALDNLNLVHMNGRVDDPVSGRLVSSDPYIDGADNTQGFNRYSYLKNNTLSSIDATGFGDEDWIDGGPTVTVSATGPPDSLGPLMDRHFAEAVRDGLGRAVDQIPDGDEPEVEVTVTGQHPPPPPPPKPPAPIIFFPSPFPARRRWCSGT